MRPRRQIALVVFALGRRVSMESAQAAIGSAIGVQHQNGASGSM